MKHHCHVGDDDCDDGDPYDPYDVNFALPYHHEYGHDCDHAQGPRPLPVRNVQLNLRLIPILSGLIHQAL